MSMSATPCLTIADMEKDFLLRCLKNAVKANEILAAENDELRQLIGAAPREQKPTTFKWNKKINRLLSN